MSEKVVSAALEEIMEDEWILNYCTKEPALRSRKSVCQKGRKGALQASAKKRHHKEDTDMATKRFKVGPGKTRLSVDHTVKRKGNHGSRHLKDVSSEPLRRSFWQLERLRDNGGYGEHRRTTRLSEKNPPKRRIRKPKWLLEDSGTLEENNVPQKIKRHGLRLQRHHQLSVEKTSETGQIKSDAKHNSHLMARENNSKHQKGLSLDSLQPANPPQVILELSLPDNELMGSFIEDTCHRQRGFPQVLLYRPTVKIPATSQPVKTVHRKEVVLRARDATMFLQQLHCYARRPKGKGNGLNIQGSVSTITRSSVQGSPPKSPHGEIIEKPEFPSHTPAAEVTESPVLEKVQTQKAVSRKTSSPRELSEKSAVRVNDPVSSQTRATGKVLQTRTRELHKKSEMKLANASQISAATEVTESPMLDKALQAQTRELCEESAVEMKVTIASQAPTVGKVTQSPGLDKISKTQTVKDSSKIKTSAELLQNVHTNQTGGGEENPSKIGAADPMLPDVVHRDGKQLELNSQAEIGYPEVHTTVGNSMSEVDVSPKPSENDTTPGGTRVARPRDQDNINDISALTLVTEMVTELAPEKLAHKQPPPEESSSEEARAGSKAKVPHKSHTTSSCSVPYLGASAVADVQGMTEGIHYFDPETSENSEPIETEESRLEYCCTFCNKVFKGSRVVAHAMFHYRRDECMFCGTMFKDDLLAMMHLSNHIEKLKRSKELPANKAQENCVSDTKDFSTPETSAKDKTTNMSSGRRSRGRPRKSAVSPNSISLPDSTPTGPRKLRSNDKPMDGPSLPEKKQNAPKHLNSQTPVHKVNGHIGKKKEPDRRKKDTVHSAAKLPRRKQEITEDGTSDGAENPRLQENRDTEMYSTTSVQVVKDFSCSTDNKIKKTGSLKVPKTSIKQNGKEKHVDPQEKVCCPVDGCGWFTDLSKNRVALLYHALNDHDGEVRPLQLAFRIGNNKCSICMRVLWSFEHFQHHVERHRLSPRHPCPHQGCTARFKTGMEMRRHARRHIPLQAVCCLPGCSQLFICLWALNLHEREHYASKSTKPNKITNEQTGGKHNNTPTVKKQLDHKPTDETATTTVTKTVSFKATRKSRGQAAHNQELKGSNETKDSDVLKNLSNKHTSTQPSGPSLRLRQTFKKMKAKNTALKSHKVLSSSLLRHNIKVRHKFKKRQVKVNSQGPKRRGRPPKSKKAVHDENITTGQDSQETEQKSPTQPTGPSKAAGTSNVKEEVKEKEKSQQVRDVVKTTETSISESKSKKSTSKQIKKDPVKQRGVSHNTSKPGVTVKSSNQSTTTTTTTSADKTQKSTVDKVKKIHKVKKRSATEEIGTASSDSSKSKKQKVTNGKANTKMKKKCHPTEQDSASKKPAESNSAVPQVEPKTAAAPIEHSADEDGKANAENTDSTQNSSGNSVPAVQGNGINEITATPTISGEKTHKVTTEEKSKKSHITKKEGKKEKGSRTASSGSGKTKKRHNDTNKKEEKKLVKERRPCKDASKTLKKTGSPDVEGKAKEETLNAALDNSGSSVSVTTAGGVNDTTSQLPAPEKDTQKAAKKEKSKKPHVPKNLDPNKANKKRKVVHKEGETKTVKKKCKVQAAPSVLKAAKSNAKVKPATVPSSVAEDGNVSAETPQSPSNCPGYSMIMNGQASTEDSKSTVCKEALAEYGKKPYMRPPPTAYLDERYTTMPKRRKAMSFSPPSQRSVEQVKVTTALQRQRCANCFATFNSAEDLQSHLQQQKCSNIFGFDSDDEGESAVFIIEIKSMCKCQCFLVWPVNQQIKLPLPAPHRGIR